MQTLMGFGFSKEGCMGGGGQTAYYFFIGVWRVGGGGGRVGRLVFFGWWESWDIVVLEGMI